LNERSFIHLSIEPQASIMNKRVEFFFDVGSPASYLAWTQLPGLCEKAGAELVYRPMLLGGVFQATGNASPASVPAKGRHSNVDLGRFAKRYGVPLVINPFFPIITLMLMRGAAGVQMRMPERFQDYLRGVFKAFGAPTMYVGEEMFFGQDRLDFVREALAGAVDGGR
jgi:2-hydroxychromene-2-carboxylate isomerase